MPESRVQKASFSAFARQVVRATVLLLFRLVYRVRVVGRENLPPDSAALLIANHVTYIDAILIGAEAGRRWIRFVIFREFLDKPVIGTLLRFFLAVPVSPSRAKEALKITTQVLRRGDLVCVFPEGQLTRHGLLNPLKRGFEIMARGASVPVVPIWLDNVWGSIFSFERQRFFGKRPRHLPYHVGVYFGQPIAPAQASAESCTSALRALSAQALNDRPELRSSLDFEIIAALRKRPRHACFIDGRNVWSCGKVLATALSLAARWKNLPGRVVRVVMPAGVEAALTNIALVIAGKIPLNARAGNTLVAKPGSNERALAAMAVAESQASRLRFIDGLPGSFAQPVIDLAEFQRVLATANPIALGMQRLLAWWPTDWFVQRVPGEGACVALETSAFTHRSLLAQILQLTGTSFLAGKDALLTSEPLHTAAGSVLGLWYPILIGIPIAFHPPPSGFPSVVALGEPPPGLTPAFTLNPGLNCLALDHLPAVITISQPDPPIVTSTSNPQSGAKAGTLGRLLSGFATAFDEHGELMVGGPAVPNRYDSFVPTGLRAHFDEDDMLVSDDARPTNT